MPDHRSLAAAALLATLLAPPPARAQARPGDVGDVMAEVLELRRQVAGLHLVLRQRDEMLDGMRKELRGVGDEVQALKERVAPPVALPFLSGPPPSTDSVGVAKVAVFAPRVAVDSARRHDIVFLQVRRVEAGGIRQVADVELGGDVLAADLPIDQNGALYIVDWKTSEGQTYNLLLRDGAGGPEALGGQPAASVQVKPLQSQGRFIFVGYRVE
jgi:hypothetical protein